MWLTVSHSGPAQRHRPGLTVVNHLPAPLLDTHFRLLRYLVEVWASGEDDNSVPTGSHLGWLFLLDSINGGLVFGVWPEYPEWRPAYVPSDPGVVEA